MDFTVSGKMQTIIAMMDEFVEKELIALEPDFLGRPLQDLWPVLEEKLKLIYSAALGEG